MKAHLNKTIGIGLVAASIVTATAVLSSNSSDRRSGRDAVEALMQRIIIPEISFRQADIRDVIDFLVQTSREHDPEQKGVNIILNLPASSRDTTRDLKHHSGRQADLFETKPATRDFDDIAPITFHARDLSLHEALQVITQLTQLTFRISGNIVFVVPHDEPDGPIVIRSYHVLPSMESRVRDLQRDLEDK